MDPPALITTRQYGQKHGLSRNAVYKRLKRGKLQGIRLPHCQDWFIEDGECDLDKYWTVAEAAEAWGCSKSYVHERLWDGRLPDLRRGRLWLIAKRTPRP